jgi:CRP-like cAMP-binding protein
MASLEYGRDSEAIGVRGPHGWGRRIDVLTPAGRDRLIDLDPDLALGLEPDDVDAAREHIRVMLLSLEGDELTGKWGDTSASIAGLLIAKGAMLREVSAAQRVTAELVGPGDLIRPFQEDGEEDLPVRADIYWRVVQPVVLAVIDAHVLQAASRWPSILAALAARGVRRSQRLSVNLSISHMVRIADRLLLLFWHLSTHWGRVTPDGIVINLPLTHAQLALMVGSERPSVTTALGRLGEEGLITRLPSRGWLLQGPVPEDISVLLSRSGPLVERSSL